jgi:hexosaminidase
MHAGKEETFDFLETVLSEVLDMFPCEYIHLGGDECPKVRWAECSACQARMRSENIPDENRLQTWFIERAAHFVRRRGRTIIGWDEVVEGGIPKGTVVMGWRGSAWAVQAAKLGHKVIMCPNTRCYFDYRQSLDMRVRRRCPPSHTHGTACATTLAILSRAQPASRSK